MHLVNIVSGNGLLLVQHTVITWTNDDVLLIGPSGISLSEIWVKMQPFSFKEINFKMEDIFPTVK